MGYLFLAIALLAGSTKGFCGKKASGYIKGFRSTILASTLRMVLCAAVGFVLVLVGNGPSAFAAPGELYLVSALYGLSMASMVVLWLIIVKKSVYTLLNIFATMGLLIPLITTRILFGEPIEPIQCLGLCVLFSAVLIMCSYNNSVKGKLTLPVLGLLISYGTVCGLCDLSSKLFVKFVPNTPTVIKSPVSHETGLFRHSTLSRTKPARVCLSVLQSSLQTFQSLLYYVYHVYYMGRCS